MIKHDERVGDEMNADINKISTLLVINFVIRISKIALVILTICYFLGLGWYIFCDLIIDFSGSFWESKTPEELLKLNTDNYIEYYGFKDHTNGH